MCFLKICPSILKKIIYCENFLLSGESFSGGISILYGYTVYAPLKKNQGKFKVTLCS